ncbi:MAG: flagellar protein FlgN [Lachnospiraceae bacterium]
MASLMDELLGVLEREEAEYRQLVEASTRKKEVIIKADIKSLEEITGEEQEIAGRIKNIENRRIAIMSDIANVLNRKVEELTVDAMMEVLKSQPKEQAQLAEIRTRLKDTLTEMKEINEQNQTLINQAMEMVEFDMALLKSLRQAPETANYNKNAYNTGDLLGSGGFDAKQ